MRNIQQRFIMAGLAGLAMLLAGCANNYVVLKQTQTGGDVYPKVTVDTTNQLDLGAINVGDTVVYAPGSMRSVVASPEVRVTLIDKDSNNKEELEKALTVNKREESKIEVMKGKLFRGDFFIQDISIDLQSSDPNQTNIDLVLLAFNRGKKDFRGDLTIYDRPPPDLTFISADGAAKYEDHQALKSALSVIPIIQYVSLGMDNFSKSSETPEMQQEAIDDIYKYTFHRLVLAPGEAVGFTIHLKFKMPAQDELDELRVDALPLKQQPGM